MATATGWLRHHPGVLLLLAAVVLGQLLRKLAQPYLADSPLVGQLPLVPAATLAAALVLALLIVWLRIRLGQQLSAAAHNRALALPDPATLPRRYAITDAPGHVTSGGLGVLDLVLLLLVQATLLPPVLALADRFYIPRTTADGAFVGVVVLIALVMLIKLWRIGGPVLVLLLWWALDRVVPTAGFLGARADVASAATTTARPVSAPAATPPAAAAQGLAAAASAEPTVAAASADAPTVAAASTAEPASTRQPTIAPAPASDAATVAAAAPSNAEPGAAAASTRQPPTVAAADKPSHLASTTPDDEATILAESTIVSRPKDDDATVLRPESA